MTKKNLLSNKVYYLPIPFQDFLTSVLIAGLVCWRVNQIAKDFNRNNKKVRLYKCSLIFLRDPSAMTQYV